MKALYEYRGTLKEHEDTTDEGVIKAIDESDARAKLAVQGYSDIQLKRIRGVKALFERLTGGV